MRRPQQEAKEEIQGDSSREGLRNEALRSKLCIRQHCSMIEKGKKKKTTSLLSCLIFITCTYKFKRDRGGGGKRNVKIYLYVENKVV